MSILIVIGGILLIFGLIYLFAIWICSQDQVKDEEFEQILNWFKTNKKVFIQERFNLKHIPTGYEIWTSNGCGFYSIRKSWQDPEYKFSFIKQFRFHFVYKKALKEEIIIDNVYRREQTFQMENNDV